MSNRRRYQGPFPLFLRRAIGSVAPNMRYQHNWHIDAISEYLMACERGEVTRLIINLPPRMLKSTIISVAWPAWLLGHDPSQRIMAASYAQSLSIKHSTDCRVILQSEWYRRLFPQTHLCADQNEKEKFSTTLRGYRRAVSVGIYCLVDRSKTIQADKTGVFSNMVITRDCIRLADIMAIIEGSTQIALKGYNSIRGFPSSEMSSCADGWKPIVRFAACKRCGCRNSMIIKSIAYLS